MEEKRLGLGHSSQRVLSQNLSHLASAHPNSKLFLKNKKKERKKNRHSWINTLSQSGSNSCPQLPIHCRCHIVFSWCRKVVEERGARYVLAVSLSPNACEQSQGAGLFIHNCTVWPCSTCSILGANNFTSLHKLLSLPKRRHYTFIIVTKDGLNNDTIKVWGFNEHGKLKLKEIMYQLPRGKFQEHISNKMFYCTSTKFTSLL